MTAIDGQAVPPIVEGLGESTMGARVPPQSHVCRSSGCNETRRWQSRGSLCHGNTRDPHRVEEPLDPGSRPLTGQAEQGPLNVISANSR